MRTKTNIDELLKEIGVKYVDTIAERRGSLVVNVRRGRERLVLKLHVDGEGEVASRKVELLAHEGKFLSDIPHLTNDLYVDRGRVKANNWLLMRVIDGVELNQTMKNIRDTSDRSGNTDNQLFAHLLSVSAFYDDLYKAGYLHGDVQPAHIYLEHNKVTVIDWGLARKIDEPNSLYKGGFIYFVAPEVAEQMLEKSINITYSPCAEVYGIGATMFLLYTGHLALYFGAPKSELKDVPIEQKLGCVIRNRINEFSYLGVRSNDSIEDFLRKSLSTNPKDRFSNPSEMHDALVSLKP